MSEQPWFRGPEVSPEASAPGDLYQSLLMACYGVSPVIRHDRRSGWVMNLDWYKRVRAALGAQADPDADDPDKWKPSPLDRLLGMPVTVTDDGGAPHIENHHYPADFDACPLPDHGGHRRAVQDQPVDRPQVGRRRPLGAHQRQAVPLVRRRRPGVLRQAP